MQIADFPEDVQSQNISEDTGRSQVTVVMGSTENDIEKSMGIRAVQGGMMTISICNSFYEKQEITVSEKNDLKFPKFKNRTTQIFFRTRALLNTLAKIGEDEVDENGEEQCGKGNHVRTLIRSFCIFFYERKWRRSFIPKQQPLLWQEE